MALHKRLTKSILVLVSLLFIGWILSQFSAPALAISKASVSRYTEFGAPQFAQIESDTQGTEQFQATFAAMSTQVAGEIRSTLDTVNAQASQTFEARQTAQTLGTQAASTDVARETEQQATNIASTDAAHEVQTQAASETDT